MDETTRASGGVGGSWGGWQLGWVAAGVDGSWGGWQLAAGVHDNGVSGCARGLGVQYIYAGSAILSTSRAIIELL